jgi:cytochrome c553
MNIVSKHIIYSETRRRFLLRAGLLAGALIACLVAAALFVYAGGSALAATMAEVDAARLTKADQDAANWLSYGRTYSEQRFSPLARITADNAKKLGLAWYADFDSNRGQQATPNGYKLGAPTLQGQQPDYIERQLAAFAQGMRENDINRQMRTIARQLKPEEMRAIAEFYGGGADTELAKR